MPSGRGQLRRICRFAAQPASPQALSAAAPNPLYSGELTYLPTAIKGQFCYLCLFLDMFTRQIIGWQVFTEESSHYASAVAG
ncbi:hypothetical protein [Candidatus Methylobacter favarea]|uniref:hypothetical protein n=1 Tax=Candidatus Methylobacter favarea TaxID=2707345 RepID=UPI001C2D9B99|nr:hypothetical protein [Candidatus Methylobacter favarea]